MSAALVAVAAGVGKRESSGEPGRILLMGPRTAGYEDALRRLGMALEKRSSLAAMETLSPERWAGVIVSACDYPGPTQLSGKPCQALEAFVKAGGRALIEFATPGIVELSPCSFDTCPSQSLLLPKVPSLASSCFSLHIAQENDPLCR